MKTISQREFQNAYVSPTEEQTARLQAKLDRLTKSPEEKPAERRSKPRLAFVLAAALLLIGTFTAVAATLKYYAVSWDGKVKDYQPSEEFREPYEYPDEITVPLDRAIHEGYFAKVVFDGEEHGFDPETTIESEEEAIALLDAEGYPHPTPLIPEGYQFAQCYIQYGSFDGLRHIENAIYSGKYTLYIYSVAPENVGIFAYNVICEDKNNPDKSCSIFSDLGNGEINNHTFIFEADDQYDIQNLTVPGMDKAISLCTPEENCLHMFRNLTDISGIKATSSKYATQLDWHQYIIATGDIDAVIALYSNQPESK